LLLLLLCGVVKIQSAEIQLLKNRRAGKQLHLDHRIIARPPRAAVAADVAGRPLPSFLSLAGQLALASLATCCQWVCYGQGNLTTVGSLLQ